MITFDTSPDRYRHWTLTVEPPIAILTLVGDGDRDPSFDNELALDPCDLSVEIELYDALQRLRFEHPEVGAVILTASPGKGFCTGTHRQRPARSPHAAPVSHIAFANETRCAIEDSTANSGQRWLAALNGTASGGGYDLALAADEILLVDDGHSAVSLPGLTTFGVLPGTDALTRLVEKRRVRPDLADVFATLPEGLGGEQAREWGLVDKVVSPDCFTEVVRERALEASGSSPRPPASEGVELRPLQREEFDGGFAYPDLRVELDGKAQAATLTLVGPARLECFAPEPGPRHLRALWWPLAACRELDDALLMLRTNWPALGTLVLRTEGDPLAIAAADVAFLAGYEHDWFVREVVLYWKRTLKRLELTSHTVIALIEPGSCYVGTLLELALAADRAYVLDSTDPGRPETAPAQLVLTGMNFGPLPRSNGLTRLETRFLGRDAHVDLLSKRVGDPIEAAEAAQLGLVTSAPADRDWNDEVRRVIRERAALSPSALARLKANLHAVGPETLETKIFGRLTLWI